MTDTSALQDTTQFDVRSAIGLTEAAKLLRGRGGKAPHVESLRRWATRGCKAGSKRIRLQTVLLNNERLTMPVWVEQFERERVRASMEKPLPVRSASARAAAIKRADEAFERFGKKARK